MNTVDRVVIVGAGAAGVDCAAELRRLGFTGAVTLLGAEPELPYDRPPLSKEYLAGTWPADKLALRPPGFYAENGIDLRLGQVVAGVSLGARSILAGSGVTLPFDALVIATGLRPRLIGPAGDDRVLVLRTLRDAETLRDRVGGARRVAVIGTGYLGCELAASCRQLGDQVTLIGPDQVLLGSQLGLAVGQVVTRIHQEQGVDVRTGAGVAAIEAEGTVRTIVLSDRTRITADLVILAIGSQPNTEWLAGSGLVAPGGVHCDEAMTAAPGVWAVGDVAAVQAVPDGGWLRNEHRMHATESAMRAAAAILGDSTPAVPAAPYMWTDQFAHRIQVYGRVPAGASPVFTHAQPAKTEFVAVYPDAAGYVAAVVGCNAPRATRLARSWVASRRPLADVPVG